MKAISAAVLFGLLIQTSWAEDTQEFKPRHRRPHQYSGRPTPKKKKVVRRVTPQKATVTRVEVAQEVAKVMDKSVMKTDDGRVITGDDIVKMEGTASHAADDLVGASQKMDTLLRNFQELRAQMAELRAQVRGRHRYRYERLHMTMPPPTYAY
jgi:hypothetical protein